MKDVRMGRLTLLDKRKARKGKRSTTGRALRRFQSVSRDTPPSSTDEKTDPTIGGSDTGRVPLLPLNPASLCPSMWTSTNLRLTSDAQRPIVSYHVVYYLRSLRSIRIHVHSPVSLAIHDHFTLQASIPFRSSACASGVSMSMHPLPSFRSFPRIPCITSVRMESSNSDASSTFRGERNTIRKTEEPSMSFPRPSIVSLSSSFLSRSKRIHLGYRSRIEPFFGFGFELPFRSGKSIRFRTRDPSIDGPLSFRFETKR